MDIILQQIANTILANLANTTSCGLFDGKMGVCLFLYKYAHYSQGEQYEIIASELFDDVLSQLNPNMSPSVIDGIAGIGYGVIDLLKNNLVESSSKEDVLYNFDRVLLDNMQVLLMKESYFPVPLFSSGMYLFFRKSLNEDATIAKHWLENIFKCIKTLIANNMNQTRCRLNLSLLNSLLFVLNEFYDGFNTDKTDIDSLIKNIQYLSSLVIKQGRYYDIDILFAKKISKKHLLNLDIVDTQYLEDIKLFQNSPKMSLLDMWYENMWWSLLYKIPIVENISFFDMKSFISSQMRYSFYDEKEANSKLSAIGLYLLSNYMLE